MKRTQAPVSTRAVFARVNRKLAHETQRLRQCRQDSRGYRDLGDLYIVDWSNNSIVATDCDLETVAREVGALAPWEKIRD